MKLSRKLYIVWLGKVIIMAQEQFLKWQSSEIHVEYRPKDGLEENT